MWLCVTRINIYWICVVTGWSIFCKMPCPVLQMLYFRINSGIFALHLKRKIKSFLAGIAFLLLWGWSKWNQHFYCILSLTAEKKGNQKYMLRTKNCPSEGETIFWKQKQYFLLPWIFVNSLNDGLALGVKSISKTSLHFNPLSTKLGTLKQCTQYNVVKFDH